MVLRVFLRQLERRPLQLHLNGGSVSGAKGALLPFTPNSTITMTGNYIVNGGAVDGASELN